MKSYLDLIRTDLIMMSGGKSSMLSLAVMTLIFGIAVGIFLDPLGVLICMFMVSAMAPTIVFQLQSKNNCERLYAVLPIERKHIVTARFIFMAAVYLALCVIMYAVVKISFALNIFENSGYYENLVSSLGMNYETLVMILFFVVFAVGAAVVGITLKSWFLDSEQNIISGARKLNPKRTIIFLFVFAALIFVILVLSGEIPLSAAALVILQLMIQLISAADGVLFSAFMITLGVFSGVYNYICTVLAYDDRDL